MTTYASPANTYQWNDANGPISGATSSTYVATSTGTYSLTVTTPAGCVVTSSGFAVTISAPSVPTGLFSSNVQLNRGTMNWGSVSNAHHYDVRLRAQGSSTWTTLILNISSTSQQKTGLSSSTTYEWQVRSACTNDSSSVSAWSSIQTFTTWTPCSTPVNPTTINIGLTSATITWDAVTGTWGYRIRYKKTTDPWSAWVYDTVSTNSYSLTSLSGGTAYQWQVRAMCQQTAPFNNSGFTPHTIFSTGSCASVSLSTSQSNVSCNGGSDGSIDLTVNNGSGSYTYSWDNGSTSEDISSLSAGTYTVIVTDNNWSCIDTSVIVITEPAALSVVLQSSGSATVCSGSTVPLSMTTYASPANTYQWNDANGPISGATSSTYVATSTGTYSLTVTTPAGCVVTSSGFAVTISAPSVPASLSSSNIQLDRATMNWGSVSNAHHYDVRLRAQGSSTWTTLILNISSTSQQKTGLSSSTTYEWQVRSACTNDSSSVSAWSSIQTFTTWTPCSTPVNPTTINIGLTSATITWDAVAGTWGYRIRYKKTTDPWSAWVYDTVSTNSYSLTSLSGGTAYQWQVRAMCQQTAPWNNSGFTPNTVFSTGSCASVSLSTSQSNVSCNGGSDGSIDLTVNNGSGSYTYSWDNGSTSEDISSLSAGTYTVIVTDNNWGCIDTSVIVITEPAALSVVLQSSGSATVCSGSTVPLSMTTYASPANTYQWNDANGPISGATSSTYVATSTGTYSLTLTTPAGCVVTSSGFAVTILVPSVPASLSSSNIQLDRATMNWGSVSNAHHYDVRLRAQGSSTWTTLILNISSTSQQKTGLSSSTTYEWQVRSACTNDSSSVSAWSSIQTFVTLTPCVVPSNSNTTNIGLTSATMIWDAVAGAWGYRIRYKKTTDPWSAWIYDTINTNSYSLSGLTNGTYYHWQISSMCDAAGSNNSSFTGYITFTTLLPCSDPSSLIASNVTHNSVLLSWNGTSAASAYNILYRLSGSSSWDTTTITNNYSSTAVSYTLTGLTSGSLYEWKIFTTCVASGNSSSVSGTNFTTNLACIVPSGMNATNILLDRAKMNWNTTSNAHHYDIRMRNQGGSWLYIGYIFGNSLTKYNLTSGTVYEWQVRGVCSSDTSNVSAWSSLQTFTTLAPCTKPTNTNVTSISSNQATLVWDAVPSATSYDVRFKLTTDPWGAWVYTYGVSTNQLTKTGLSSGTYYHWQVRSVCGSSNNTSGFTSYNTFTTTSGSRFAVSEDKNQLNVSIYPNPTEGKITLKFISEDFDDFSISIFDSFGKLIYEEDKRKYIGEFSKNIDLSLYKKGIYFIKIKTKYEIINRRVLLQ